MERVERKATFLQDTSRNKQNALQYAFVCFPLSHLPKQSPSFEVIN